MESSAVLASALKRQCGDCFTRRVASEVVADSNDLAHEDVSNTLIRQDGDAEGVVSNLKGSLLVLNVIKFIANACWS